MLWKQALIYAANAPLRLVGARLVSAHDSARLDRFRDGVTNPGPFRLGGATFEQFAHRYNCGWPPLETATERSVELAVADRWLDLVDPGRVLEVGAVTPYYWPGRVAAVLDPTDAHPRVTTRASVFDTDLSGRAVLSVSTFEHIGRADYGLAADEPAAGRALDKLFAEASQFLVTFAAGYNPWFDRHVLARTDLPPGAVLKLLVRNPSGVGWAERPAAAENLRPYGSAGGNAVFFLHRGTSLFGAA